MFKRFVLAFCELPTNVLFTALSLKVEDEEGEPFLTPDIQGKGYQISQYVCGQMSAYGYMKILRQVERDEDGNVAKDSKGNKKIKRIRQIIWQDTGVVRGKDRYDVLAPHTSGKTLKQINDMIEAGPKQDDEPQAAAAQRRTTRKAN